MYYGHPLYQESLITTAKLQIPWDKLKNKRVLIAGASGLIGCFLVDLLMYRNKNFDDNTKIYAMGRNEVLAKERFALYWGEEVFTFLEHDINDPMVFEGNMDFIVHAASNTHPMVYASDPIGTITTNTIGTYNLLQYAMKCKAQRFTFLSSVEIYGENRGDVEKFDEDYCGYINCNTLRAGYPESKRAGETLCNAFTQKYGMEIVIPRLSRVYGPTMLNTDSKAINQFIKNAVTGEDIVLKSEGNQFFSYCYVADAVAAILTIMLKGKAGEAYNIADDGSDITLKELAKVIANIAGKKVIFELPNETEKKGFSKATKAVLDSSKLKSLRWKPVYDITTGLERTINILKSS